MKISKTNAYEIKNHTAYTIKAYGSKRCDGERAERRRKMM